VNSTLSAFAPFGVALAPTLGMERSLERVLTAMITFLVLAFLLASSVGVASLARTEPLISKGKRQSAARATPVPARATTQPEHFAEPAGLDALPTSAR
jgi:hypothetical protein